MSKLIYTSDSPNTRRKDWTRSVSLLLSPWKWKSGDGNEKVVKFFSKYYPEADVYAFNYARSAMYTLFRSLDLPEGSEVIYQSCTCAAASLPAIWAGLKPVYVDINERDLSPPVENIKAQLNENTKVIVVQYTMGFSPDTVAIRELAQTRGLILIEDCTHFIPSGNSPKVGDYGDFVIFSFGRDKVISGVDGGVLVSHDPEASKKIEEMYKGMSFPNTWWIIQRILYGPMWVMIRATYNVKLGKLIHLISKKLGLLTRATSPMEKKGFRPDYVPSLLPNALAELAALQLEDIDQLQSHRNEIAEIYRSELKEFSKIKMLDKSSIPPLRFPLLVEDRDLVMSQMKQRNILLGDWYSKPVAPNEVLYSVSKYLEGSCSVAESVADQIINLPTHVNITEEDARYICENLREVIEGTDNQDG